MFAIQIAHQSAIYIRPQLDIHQGIFNLPSCWAWGAPHVIAGSVVELRNTDSNRWVQPKFAPDRYHILACQSTYVPYRSWPMIKPRRVCWHDFDLWFWFCSSFSFTPLYYCFHVCWLGLADMDWSLNGLVQCQFQVLQPFIEWAGILIHCRLKM